mmetsp:Transcript_12332/g.28936  ORF Transcript_12332/g.28936 Transcript_12332/m.28936 type:complete len:355 (-) Transcript_12332:87-1151(-)
MRHEESLQQLPQVGSKRPALLQLRFERTFQDITSTLAVPSIHVAFPPLPALVWGLVAGQAAMEIAGLALVRMSTMSAEAHNASHRTLIWSVGVILYMASLLVYCAALSNAALSWLVVVSCSVNILLSVLSSFGLGESLRFTDYCAIACALTSAVLMAIVVPDVDPDRLLEFGNKLQTFEPFPLKLVSALLVVQVMLMAITWKGPPSFAAPAAVLCYSTASGSAQMFTKLFTSTAPGCGLMPSLSQGPVGDDTCVHGVRGPYAFLTLCVACGAVSTTLMIRGAEWYEAKFWLPNALAVDLVVTALIGLLVCGEAHEMTWQHLLCFFCSMLLSACSLRLATHEQAQHQHSDERPKT